MMPECPANTPLEATEPAMVTPMIPKEYTNPKTKKQMLRERLKIKVTDNDQTNRVNLTGASKPPQLSLKNFTRE
jgi:hypothetical protein